jgi:ubiquinone/menaquinone biosynthesis C-methylase UbiE
MAGIKPSDTVLDLGSGCGFGTAVISKHAGKVIACDISSAYLEFARGECAGSNNIDFEQISSRNLAPVEDRSVDKVISMAVFIHLNLYDIYLYFEEFSRILKPGGKVLIDFANQNRLFSRIPNRRQDQQFLTHAGYYRDDPGALASLVQWNSARGIKGVARTAGFKFLKRRGHKLLFRK